MIVHEIKTKKKKIFIVRFLIYNLLEKSKSFLGGITKIYHAVSPHGLRKQIHFQQSKFG